MLLRQVSRSIILRQRESFAAFRSYSSNETKPNDTQSKHNYFKHLHEMEQANLTKPEGWDKAKPFKSIPGYDAVPLLGNSWRLMIGDLRGKELNEMMTHMYNKFGDICKIPGILGQDWLLLFKPEQVETMFRNEGVWPVRPKNESIHYYRTVERKEWFQSTVGLVTEGGEEWQKFRTVVNPILMQPRVVPQYVHNMDVVANDFLKIVRKLAGQNAANEMPANFENELNKWALESICLIAMEKRLGCLDDTPNPEVQKIIESVITAFNLMFKLDFQVSFWKWFSTPDWKLFVKCVDYTIGVARKHIFEAHEKMMANPIDKPESEQSVLEKLLKIDKEIAFVMVADMIFAGIDTTSKVVGAALYFLARNPAVQESLRAELLKLLPNKDSPITKDVLANASYLKAAVKEAARLAPISSANVREATRDIIIDGYQVPKGTWMIAGNMLISKRDFHEADQFLPERWLRSTTGDLSYKNTSAFASLPFGFGPRSCVGKRLANLEMEVIVAKMIRNFKLEWNRPDMKFRQKFLYGIDDPLQLTVKELDN